MLTGKMVRVRYVKHHVLPYYLDAADPEWVEAAERMLQMFRAHVGGPRGELEADVDDTFGDAPNQLVFQGLAKLLEDRCEFAVVSGHPPEEVRAAVFRIASRQRVAARAQAAGEQPHHPPAFPRAAVLEEAAAELGVPVADVERGMFADLKTEQQITSFEDISAERLLQRYNVALAQAILFRATAVEVRLRGEPPQRYRQLLRLVKFHQLICDVEAVSEDVWCLKLDGPLSLFSATQKYGLQLAKFLPALLKCKNFELNAELRWGPDRRPKKFRLTSGDGLVSHYVDAGMYVPPELAMFVELFRKRVEDWDISESPDLVPLGNGFWVPDFQLIHRASGQVVWLDVLGFWRRSSVETHLQRLRLHAPGPFVLAVSEQLSVEESELEGLTAGVLRFRQMPLPKEVARAADAVLGK